ncbi:MAG: response regulator [Caldilineaceae bacterium]
MAETPKRILLVDDDPILRMGFRDLLENAGYAFHSVAGGAEALQLAQEQNFALIILDLLMPRPNGFEVFRRLKELSVASRTPILILTVVGLEPQVQNLLQQGAHYLSKQRAPRGLVAKVRELIGE